MRERLRLGMVGGGPKAFIGAVHRTAARMSDRYELVASALCSDRNHARAFAQELGIPRGYGTFQEMAEQEAVRTDGIQVVSIVTPFRRSGAQFGARWLGVARTRRIEISHA
jgi:predicted dehydrogenase